MRVIFAILLTQFACLGQVVITVPQPSSRDKVIAVGESLIGVTEATGKNDGPVIEKILRSAGASKGDPYCAAFNTFCYIQAGLGNLVPHSAWSPDWVRSPTWTYKNGGKTPLPADAWGIYFQSKNRVAHTGLVRSWRGSCVITLEANTSPDATVGSAADRDGQGIYSKRRLTKQIYSVRNWIDPR